MTDSHIRPSPGRQNILIVGCGYLGRRAAVRWIETGAHVSALTRSPDHAEQLRELGIHPVIGDVTCPESLETLPAADVLLYAVGLDRSSGNSQREVYVNGLSHVLERVQGQIGRLVYISSTSVYGQNLGEWVDEDSVCQPTASNGVVCLEAESLVSRHIPKPSSGVGSNILRLAGIYGPGRLIARVAALQSGAMLEGNPGAWLNLIHVDDAVSAVFGCLQRGCPGRTYLVSDDRPVARREYYETVAKLVHAPEPRFDLELPDAEKRSLNKRCCNRRLREELQVTLQFGDIVAGLPNALGSDS
jgi:nucleoside-diphosphate-sugar epimerase